MNSRIRDKPLDVPSFDVVVVGAPGSKQLQRLVHIGSPPPNISQEKSKDPNSRDITIAVFQICSQTVMIF